MGNRYDARAIACVAQSILGAHLTRHLDEEASKPTAEHDAGRERNELKDGKEHLPVPARGWEESIAKCGRNKMGGVAFRGRCDPAKNRMIRESARKGPIGARQARGGAGGGGGNKLEKHSDDAAS